MVNQLLTLMDGAEGLDGVYVLAATRLASNTPVTISPHSSFTADPT